MVNITDQLIDYLFQFSQSFFEDKEIAQVKRCLLDYIGVTFAGSCALGRKRDLLIEQFDCGLSESPVIGANMKVNVEGSAFINGISSHLLELDDGVRYGGIHLGAPIFSALLAVGELERIDSDHLIRGVLTGYEAGVRLAAALQPYHHNRGYHPTGTCGTIAAAVSLAIALGFSREELKLAFSHAALNASGTLKVLEDASDMKPVNVGNASLSAVMAICGARAGFDVPADVLSGDYGFISMMAGHYSEGTLLGKDTVPKIMKVYFKSLAGCRHCHSPIEALFEIKSNRGFLFDEIKEIKIRTYDYVIGKHDHKEVQGSASAKMSVPYSVAAAILFGKVQDEQFSSESISYVQSTDLMNRIQVVEDPELSKSVPEKRPAIVEISLLNGERLIARVDYPKGEPENPLTDSELEEKFRILAKQGNKSEEDIEQVIHCVWNLDTCLSNVYALL